MSASKPARVFLHSHALFRQSEHLIQPPSRPSWMKLRRYRLFQISRRLRNEAVCQVLLSSSCSSRCIKFSLWHVDHHRYQMSWYPSYPFPFSRKIILLILFDYWGKTQPLISISFIKLIIILYKAAALSDIKVIELGWCVLYWLIVSMLAAIVAHLCRCCLIFTFKCLIEGIASEAGLTFQLPPLVLVTNHFSELDFLRFRLFACVCTLEKGRSLLAIIQWHLMTTDSTLIMWYVIFLR